jgi:hypothetical protein
VDCLIAWRYRQSKIKLGMLAQQSQQLMANYEDWDDNEFSDEEMKRLLRKAEQRLHKNAGLSTDDTRAVALQRSAALWTLL